MFKITSCTHISSHYGCTNKDHGSHYKIVFSEEGTTKTIYLYEWLCDEETKKYALKNKEFFRKLVKINIEEFAVLKRLKKIYMNIKDESIKRRLEKIKNENR